MRHRNAHVRLDPMNIGLPRLSIPHQGRVAAVAPRVVLLEFQS
jgi:hypothetical protein